MKTNREYKNSVFTFLFSDPDLLRELYCALEDVTLPEDEPVTINTLENVFFMGIYNDISFEIGGKLVVLLEQQSSINPNMALRLLMYIGRLYEKMFKEKNIYSTRRLPVPWPEFFVLYNGVNPYPDEQVIKLSDSFYKIESIGLQEKISPELELTVKVLNINEGKNEAIAGKCRKLAEYSAFISKVRYFYSENGGDKESAVIAAIKYCRSHDILSEFLELHAKEVFNMLSTEWNPELAKEVWFEEGAGFEKLRNAANLKNLGVSIEIISQATGLTIEEIEKL